MNSFGKLRGIAVAALLGVSTLAAVPAQAQGIRGFTTKLDALASGEERAAQRDLWVLEVHYKSMRLIWVELEDPKTGKKRPELVWYLAYKAITRPITQTAEEADTKPVNDLDPAPSAPIFVPEFTLVTDDSGSQQIYADVIIPEAQAAIIRRERQILKNSVEIVGPIPLPTDPAAEKEEAVYGVAMWRGVDPETDYFTVYMNGFSNGYKVGQGPNGEQLILLKTVEQKYWRPGDQFKEEETEFRNQSEPSWIYRPDVPALAATPQDAAAAPEKSPPTAKPADGDKP